MTTNKVTDINELPEIITVADLITYLQTLPQHMAVVKANMEGIGYNRIKATKEMTYPIQPAYEDQLMVDYIDQDEFNNAEVMNAVVL